LEERVKLVSVGFSHGFAVTEKNKVYTWVLQSDALLANPHLKHVPYEVSGLPAGVIITDMKSGNF
jgi:hypothetical protein